MRGAVLRVSRVGAIVTLAVSLYLLLVPHPVAAGLAPDWVGHLGLFSLLGGWVGLWAATGSSGSVSRRAATAFVCIVAFGSLTEMAQGHTGRDPQLSDALMDIVGGLGGLAVGYVAWSLLEAVGRIR